MPLEFRILRHADLGELKHRVIGLCTDAYEEDFSENFEHLCDATHVLAFESGELVSHAAWVPRELRVGAARDPLRCAYVEAVATATRLQRRGYGTQVLRALPPLLSGFRIAALSPSEPDFYARCGWEVWKGPLYYLQAGRRLRTREEDVMIHRLSGTPSALDLQDELETDWRRGDVW